MTEQARVQGEQQPREDDLHPGLDPVAVDRAIEALLILAEEPLTVQTLAEAIDAGEQHVRAALARVAERDRGRGFELREVGGGWRYYTSPECAQVVERYVRSSQNVRLTQAALETLAIVAYRQPVARGRISAIRGVNVDGVLRTLLTRGLIEEAGTDADSGAILYSTTGYFLERMGLNSLTELPPIAEHVPDLETEGLSDV